MRSRAIQEHDRRSPIRLMCRALVVSAAGYYAWRSRLESLRIKTDTHPALGDSRVPPRITGKLWQPTHLGCAG